MSDFVLHKGKQKIGQRSRTYDADVAAVEYAPGKPTRVRLANGKNGLGTCLGCADIPCATKSAAELAMAPPFDEFPGDPSVAVCPTKAIERNESIGFMTIDVDRCIGCGLCVVRCPYGAISLKQNGKAGVTTDDRDGLAAKDLNDRIHPRPKRFGTVGNLNGHHLPRMANRIRKLADTDRQLFVRNLLHEAGMNAGVRRRGDTNMRVDGVGFTRSGRPFVAEIELVGGELECPRALMEDVAVMHARYGLQVGEVDALSILMTLPSMRSEYYRVMLDINSVLGFKCRTLTVGALLSVIWTNGTIDGFDTSAFAVAEGGIDLAKSLNIPGMMEPYKGAFRPVK